MEAVKAIQRLAWRFGKATENGNTFTINQNDVDAINGIAAYIERTQKEQFKQNELFAKLYIKVYAKMIAHYKTDVFDINVRRRMNDMLSTPMEIIMQDFTEQLNDSERYVQFNNLGIDLKHPALRTNQEAGEYNEKIISLLKTSNLEDVILKDVWSFEDVKECLINEVNNAINLNINEVIK